MRKITGAVAAAVVLLWAAGALAEEPKPTPGQAKAAAEQPKKSHFANPTDEVSYAIGTDIANSIKRQEIDVNPALIAKGIQDAYAGKSVLSEEEVKATLQAFQADLRNKMMEKMKVASEKNKKDGETFLAANKSKQGVVTLPSGLQYKIIKEGTGKKPTATDTVSVNYRGTLIDGTEFDSSYSRGTPATFKVNGVIPGWTEALQLMPVGSKWELFIPPNLAYGERQAGPKIGPNSTLLFEVELLSIGEPEATTKK